jgi:hypothetical protein
VVATIAKPVTIGGTFQGVIGVDISIEELVSKSQSLNLGAFSYAFVIDKKGRTLSHPQLSEPLANSPYSYTDIRVLEPFSEFESVRTEMLLLTSGVNSAVRTVTSSRARGGDSSGARYRTSAIAYYWKNVDDSDLIAVVAIDTDDMKTRKLSNWDASTVEDTYHRTDLANRRAPECVVLKDLPGM